MIDVDGKSLGGHVPLVIGVTGHRDLLIEEQEQIKDRIRDCFNQLQKAFPELPLMVMTPLAEGADRIAAEVAHELGIPTLVLLPMPQRLYQRDFEGDSLNEFHQMLSLGECVELPLLSELSESDVQEPGHGRDLQYAQLGAYLAAHSHVLLAVWDGKPSNAPGGTGHVIKFHQHDVIDLIAEGQHRSPIDFTEDESDLVFHIVCSRTKKGAPIKGLLPGEAYWYTRDEVKPRTLYMPERYRVVFERMAEFSADTDLPVDTGPFYGLLPPADLDQCGQGARDISNLYHQADFLATRFQRLFYMGTRWTSVFALLAGGSFVAFADLPDLEFMIYLYILFIALAVMLAWLDHHFSWQRKSQDYRVLAEGLRVQFYWSVAGVEMENPSRFSHDSFLKRQDLELGWIRNVMRYAGHRADSTDRRSTAEEIDLVIEHWVAPQHDYYRRKSEDRAGRHRITGAIGTTSVVIMLIAALILGGAPELIGTPTADMLIVVMGLFPFVYAARQNYAAKMAEKELVAQYQHSVRIFSNAIGLLAKAPTKHMKCDILRALGEAALDENGQWLLRQRERPTAATQSLHG